MKSGTFASADGLQLYGEWTPAEDSAVRAGILLVHGYDDHGGRYMHVASHLARHGFSVLSLDYRGHGKAQGARGHCDNFSEYLGDLTHAVNYLAEGLQGRPLAVFGHSHGGLLLLRALCEPGRAPSAVQAAVLSSPYLGLALKVNPVKIAVGKLASRIAPRLALKNEIDASQLTHDSNAITARLSDTLCHGVATARWFTEATAAQQYVLEHVHSLTVPSLWLVAGEDAIACSATTRRAFEKAGGDKTMKVYDGMFHEIWNESDRSKVLDDLTAWLKSRFPV